MPTALIAEDEPLLAQALLRAGSELQVLAVAPHGRPFPALVFVTAYDQYAVQTFDAQAVNDLLKPVTPERLDRTVARVQANLAQPDTHPLGSGAQVPDALLAPAPAPAAPRLQVTQACGANRCEARGARDAT